jgi:GH35 family endo-1,4-beta-xylanase
MTEKILFTCIGGLLAVTGVQAQLATNPDKFLGNITTDWPGSMNYDGFVYSDYWNQVTPENGTKWSTVENTRNSYYWGGADPAYNYAKQKGFPFKFHCLVWGSQYPAWFKNLSTADKYKAIVKWMDTVKKKYPNLELIDVVNEAIDGHQADTYLMREALGGNGATGYDWIIKAFEMAHERWPNAILVYNDFNTFQGSTDQFINLVRTLRDAGAPIDAYGCQSHDLGGMNKSNFQSAMSKIQNALKMPMYISEYDIGDTNDGNQNWNYQQHFPVMWEADYCAGVTLWGWFYGHTWIDDKNTGEKGISGLIKNKQERSALKWLREYMASDKAKNVKSPFPGMKKEASVYVKPQAQLVNTQKEMTIGVTAKMRTKTVQSVALYVNNVLYQTLTEAPYNFTYTPATAKKYNLKAVVTTTDDTKYERLSGFTATNDYIPQEGDVLTVTGRLTSISAGKTFAIINEAEGKALYGSYEQNLGYDTYDKAFVESNSGYLFKLVNSSVSGKYMLRLITPKNAEYNIWNSPGYLNSQVLTGNCSFILGNTKYKNGEDLVNGAVWEIKYEAGKGFSLKNLGTGKYLKTNDTAKYDEPTYFTFATLGYQPTGITDIPFSSDTTLGGFAAESPYSVYTLQGIKVGTVSQWDQLPDGLYIVNGKKIKK